VQFAATNSGCAGGFCRNDSEMLLQHTAAPVLFYLYFLQVYSRILRRASRAVDSVSSDPYLLGLYLHRVKDAQELVTTALAEVAGSHVLLRQAFATSLASNAWGVIQHAVNLQYLLQQVNNRGTGLQYTTALFKTACHDGLVGCLFVSACERLCHDASRHRVRRYEPCVLACVPAHI